MLTLKELQMLAEQEYSVEDTRQDLNRIVEYFRGLDYQSDAVNVAFVKERELPTTIADKQRVFFIDDELQLCDIPDEYKAESLGMVHNNRLVFAGRLIYPVFDVRGDVMGFCGWDKFPDQYTPKYLDSRNHGYMAKKTTLYGMEELPVYYTNNKPVYVTEGIVCCLYLRSIGLQSLALLGSSITPYVVQILKRFGERLVVIPDNDAFGKGVEDMPESLAGEHLVSVAKRKLPKAIVLQSKVAKDIDDSRRINNHMFEDCLKKELISVVKCRYLNFQCIRVR